MDKENDKGRSGVPGWGVLQFSLVVVRVSLVKKMMKMSKDL